MFFLLYGVLGGGVFLGSAVGIQSMATIPSGCFVRGNDAGDADEKPAQQVCLSAFLIDRTEVTVADYRACEAAQICKPARINKGEEADARLPVTFVSWEEANTFCRWSGKRLPTETEWEKAARGSGGRRFPWGNEFECRRGNFGNFAMDGRCAEEGAPGKPVAVGSYSLGATPEGVFDMAGNVWEWTADAYRADAYRNVKTQKKAANSPETLRVLRGGGCCSMLSLPRASDRWALPQSYRDGDIGFRCAKDGKEVSSEKIPATTPTPSAQTRSGP